MGRSLEELRAEIDRIDTTVLALLEERAGVAEAIGHEKRRTQAKPSFYDPEREARVLKRLQERSKGAFPKASIPHVFKEIMSACRSLEASYRVAFLGPQGTYSQIAAAQVFGSSVEYQMIPTIESVFDAVERRNADYGIVPFENSAGGGVQQTLDAFIRSDLKIRGEHLLKIEHCLATNAKDPSSIKRVYSHPQAFAQCRGWLAQNLPRAEQIVSTSTGAAAESARADTESAAICSRLSAESFGLSILREGIQDQSRNATRFVTLHESDGPVTGNDRTSLVLWTAEIAKALKALESERVPILRTESRPDTGGTWRFCYFIDLRGHRVEASLKRALKKLERVCDRVKVLGSYPASV